MAACALTTLGFAALPTAAAGGQSRAPDLPAPPPCAACAVVSLTPSQALAAPERLNGIRLLLRVDAGVSREVWAPALDDLRRRGARVGLHLRGVPADTDPVLHAAGDALLIEVPAGDVDRRLFELKRALVIARSANDQTRLVLAGDSATLTALMKEDLGAYLDAVMPASVTSEIGTETRLVRWTSPSDSDLRTAAQLLASPPPATGESQVWTLTSDTIRAHSVLRDLAALQDWLPQGLIAVPDRALSCGSARLTPLLNPKTLDLIAITADCPAATRLTADVRDATIDRFQLDAHTLIRVRGGQAERFAEGANVVGARALTVEEIIARHQAAAARQALAVRTEIATGSLTLTFEAPGFPAPVTVTSRTVIYRSASRTDLQQQDVRVNGVSFTANGGVPRLPIIEPERVATPPLEIALTEAYRYRLAGTETIAGRPCYVVAFSPRSRKTTLFAGRAWIAADSFGLVRVAAVQTALRGPVTASEQTDEFETTRDGYSLLVRSDVRQTYEGAAIRTPIHRLMVIDRHEINPADFATRRASAYASPDIMLRDTPQGFRYLTREPSTQASSSGAPANALEPVVTSRAHRIRTFAFGAIVDPNISQPLPFAGISYVDFDLFGVGAQLNVFFGGSYGQLAFSAPSVRGSRWQLGARAFGIGTSYNDRAFIQGREDYLQDIRQRPAQASFWVLRPLTPRMSLRLGYDWIYTKFGAGETTADEFDVPANQVVHAAVFALDMQRAGWQTSLWWSPAQRVGWRRWGLPTSGDYRASDDDFQRYGVSASRSLALSPRIASRIEAAWMSGDDLDRFSRYAFGTFDNRLRGYPSALVRYDRGGVFRTAVAWAAAKAVRIDGFFDTAEVHDPGFGRGLRNYTGVGAALEAPAPFGTLLALEWGYGLRGINTDGRRGTHVIRLTGYKVF